MKVVIEQKYEEAIKVGNYVIKIGKYGSTSASPTWCTANTILYQAGPIAFLM